MAELARGYKIFLNDGSIKRGYTLVIDRQGTPLWDVFYAPAIASQYFTGAAGYRNIRAEEEIVVASDDWHAGLGEEVFAGLKRYFDSYGVDARWSNKFMLGPLEHTCNDVSDQTLKDLDLENWADASTLNLWEKVETVASLTVSRSTYKDSGTYCAKLTGNGAYGGAGYIKQRILQPSAFKGKSLSVTARINRQNSGDTASVYIYDDAGNTVASATGTGSYEDVTATRTIDANATFVEVRLYFQTSTQNRYAYFDNLTFAPTNVTVSMGTPVDFVEFGDDLYLITTTQLLKWDDTNSEWILVQEGTNHDAEVLGDYLYIMQGGSESDNNDYDYTDDGEYFVEYTGSDGEFDFCLKTGETLYGFELPNEMRTNTNPINGGAAWSSPTTIGDTSRDITGVVPYYNGIFIGKEDGLFEYDGTDVEPRLPEFASIVHSNNMKNLLVWQSKAYLPTNWGGLFEFEAVAQAVKDVSLSKYAPKVENLAGCVVDMAGDTEWLYGLVGSPSGSDPSYITAMRWESVAGANPVDDWRWHSIAKVAQLDTPLALHISSLHGTNRRLWYAGTHSGTGKAGYFKLPTRYANIEGQSGYEFCDSGELTLGYMDFGFPDDDKPLKSVTLLSEGLSADQTVKIEYQIDNGSWVTLATVTSSPASTHSFNEGVSARRARFRFTLSTNDSSATPVVTGFISRARIPKRKMFQFTTRISVGVISDSGAIDNTPAATLMKHLYTCADLTAGATLEDFEGTSHTVDIVQLKEVLVVDERERLPERACRVWAVKR